MTADPLSIPEVAAKLKRSVESVRRMCAAGIIRATKDGRQWLVAPEDLEDYFNKKSNRPRRRRNRAA